MPKTKVAMSNQIEACIYFSLYQKLSADNFGVNILFLSEVMTISLHDL